MPNLYTKDDVRVWGSTGGAVFYAPKGTPLPATWDEPLNAAFVPVGILSEDGLNEGLSVDSNKIKGWPPQTVRVVNTSTEKTVGFTMLQNTPLAAKLYYGAGEPVASGSGARVDLPSTVGLVEGAFVIEKHDGNVVERRCIDLGQVSERGDSSSGGEDAAGKEVTLDIVGDVDRIETNAPAFVEGVTGKLSWTVTVTGTPTGGTFRLAVGGVQTAALAYNAAAADIQTALAAIAAGTTVTGTTSKTVTFTSARTLAAVSVELTGGTSPGVTVA